MEDEPRPVLSVSELTAYLKEAVEATFPSVWIAGEVTNVSSPRSGHIYFTLKDSGAQIRAVVWRNTANRLKFDVTDGLEVVCGGGLDLYPPRGTYQLVVRDMELRGEGAQQRALKLLQERLAAEGLFAPERKRRLPRFPQRIAFVTSPTGAAIRDFCEVVKRRWNDVEILVIPSRVQGPESVVEICQGIDAANRLRPAPDVLVVGRGGGSSEDLWSFNDEAVVRAIATSAVPVISAVGHEIDVTLSDLAADVRALTPSEAAELAVPSRDDLVGMLRSQQTRLANLLTAHAASARSRLTAIWNRPVFRRPEERIHNLGRELDDLELRIGRAIRNRQRIADQSLAALATRLEGLNPLAVLARGFSLTQRVKDSQPVVDAAQVGVGEQIVTRLSRGSVISRVEEVVHEEG